MCVFVCATGSFSCTPEVSVSAGDRFTPPHAQGVVLGGPTLFPAAAVWCVRFNASWLHTTGCAARTWLSSSCLCSSLTQLQA